MKPTAEQAPKRIAVLVDTSTSWGREIISGIYRYSRGKTDWQIFVEPRGVDQRRWLPLGWQGDGVIARVGLPDLAKRLRAMKIPVINVSGIQLKNADFPRVTTDLADAANMAADYLVERGYKHFAYFSLLGLDYVAEHQQAFLSALHLKGHSCDLYSVQPHLGAEPDWNLDMKRLGKWLSARPKPLAVFTWNSSSAREIIYTCLSEGIAVPEEVSILSGCDDDLFCEVTPIPISAIHLASERMGYEAAEMLDQLINDPKTGRRPDVLVPPIGVVSRRSTDSFAVEDPALVKALRFIRDNIARELTVDDVARQSGLCRRALEQRFKQVLDRSPAMEIRRLRISRAIELLQHTDLSVAMVAELSGFSSPEYMASVFQSRMGHNPMHYRKEWSTR